MSMIMSNSLNCVLVLDKSIKKYLTFNSAELVSYDVIIINNIKELTKSMLKRTNKVIFLGKTAYSSLGLIKLYKEVCDLEYYLITDDEALVDMMQGFCKCYLLDYSSIDSNLLASVLFDDETSQKQYNVIKDKLLESDLPTRILNTSLNEDVHTLAEDYIRLRDLAKDSYKKLSRSYDVQRKLSSEIITLNRDIEIRDTVYKEQIKKDMALARALDQYQVILTKDIYEKVNITEFPNRPKILYFKEYQEFLYLESFLNTLFGSICQQMKASCKIVRLHDSCDSMRIKILQDSYKIINSSMLESDLISNDKILCYGNYIKVLKYLFENNVPLDILIIVDCKKHPDTVLSGSGVLYYGLCRTRKAMRALGIQHMDTMINNEEYSNNNVMSWSYYSEYDTSDENSERFEYLASRPVVSIIYKMLATMI